MLFNLGSKLISRAAAASLGICAGGVSPRMFSVSADTGDNIYQFSARDIDGQQVDPQINQEYNHLSFSTIISDVIYILF